MIVVIFCYLPWELLAAKPHSDVEDKVQVSFEATTAQTGRQLHSFVIYAFLIAN
jgi:hypothetical protein